MKNEELGQISDAELWNTIRQQRKIFTHISRVDYSQDIRPNICLISPEKVIDVWRQDYETMQRTMIYGNSLTFNELIDQIKQLEEQIRFDLSVVLWQDLGFIGLEPENAHVKCRLKNQEIMNCHPKRKSLTAKSQANV